MGFRGAKPASVQSDIPYATELAWAVDSVNGNDGNAGTPAAPLLTLAELSRRWRTLTFPPAFTVVDVELRGTFPNEPLVLAPNFPSNSLAIPLLTVHGQMTQLVAATAITGYTAEAPPVREALTAGAIDFAALLAGNGQVRLRLTSGANAGALAWVQSTTGLGQANISRFFVVNALTGAVSSIAPAIGDNLVVEVPATQVNRVSMAAHGPVITTVRDLQVSAPVGTTSTTYLGSARLFGCKIGVTNAHTSVVRGQPTEGSVSTLIACASQGFMTANGPLLNLFGHAGWGPVIFTSGYFLATRMQFDGAGGGAASITANNGAQVEYNANWSIFGSGGSGGRVVLIEDGSSLIGSAAASAYGTNGAAISALIRNGCQWQAVTLPTFISAGAPNELSLAGAAAVPWAFAAAVAPNNAVLNARA